jgi:CRISPR-associated protein Cas6
MTETPTVDVVFPLRGTTIAREYGDALAAQLRAALPWLGDDVGTGVHPIRGTTAVGDELLLGGRATLAVRVPQARRDDCGRLQGARLDLAGAIEIGAPRSRALLAHPTLYAPMVVTGDTDEARFFDAVRAALAAWQVTCDIIVGRRQQKLIAGRAHTGFSVMLHGLVPAASLRAQAAGIGAYRLLGCGLFVPHRSADPAFR